MSAAAITATSYASGTPDEAVSDDNKSHDVQVKSDKVDAVYSHDVTWGSMEFEAQFSNWQTGTHEYKNLNFVPVTEGADLVKVTNHSNVPLIVRPVLTTDAGYKDTVRFAIDEGPNFDSSGITVDEHLLDTVVYYTIPAANAADGAKTAEIKAKVLPALDENNEQDAAIANIPTKLNATPAAVGTFSLVFLSRVPAQEYEIPIPPAPDDWGPYSDFDTFIEQKPSEYMTPEEFAEYEQLYNSYWQACLKSWS